ETIDQEPAHLRIVLEHENEGPVSAAVRRDRGLTRASQLGDGLPLDQIERVSNRSLCRRESGRGGARGLGRERQVHSKQGAAVCAVSYLDASPVTFDELFGDGKPEPRSSEASRRAVVPRPEALEDRRAQGDRDTGAVVLDRKDGALALDAQPHPHASS